MRRSDEPLRDELVIEEAVRTSVGIEDLRRAEECFCILLCTEESLFAFLAENDLIEEATN